MDNIFIKQNRGKSSNNATKSSANKVNNDQDKLRFAKLFNMAGQIDIKSNGK